MRLTLPQDSLGGTVIAGLGLAAGLALAVQLLVVGTLPGIAALDGIARLVHILGVVLWMGHNYANVIGRPRFDGPPPTAPADTLDASFRAACYREHALFRYPSLLVWASGLAMLWHRDLLTDALLLRGDAAVIGAGAWLGMAMVANLWLVLWPHQKRVLGFVPASRAERARCARITFLSSRTNTILSVPTILFMVAGAHGAPFYG